MLMNEIKKHTINSIIYTVHKSFTAAEKTRHQTSKVDISLRDAPLDHFLAISGGEFTVLLDAVVKISHLRSFV